MLSIAQARELTAVVVPVYFQPTVNRETITLILESTFADHELFCLPEKLLVVVDEGTKAKAVLREARSGSPLYDLPLYVLDKNRGKAGAIQAGLDEILKRTQAPYVVTRDCDGDHAIEDIPRMISMAEDIRSDTGSTLISIFGVRPSLEKPMGWFRQEWEGFINRILEDWSDFLAAKTDTVVDKRYWNGYELDAQSGYRVYSRQAARLSADLLAQLPGDPDVFVFACELVPFIELILRGGLIGQVQRMTLIEQPVSSFEGVDLSRSYGMLLRYLCKNYRAPTDSLLRIFDNHLLTTSLYFSEFREKLMECRRYIKSDEAITLAPRFS